MRNPEVVSHKRQRYSGVALRQLAEVEQEAVLLTSMFTVYAIYNLEVKKIYIGQTHNIVKRLSEHNNHTFKGYTSRFKGKWTLIYKESVTTRSEALVREKQLKSYRGRESLRKYIPE